MCELPGNSTVGITSSVIVPSNDLRTGLYIRNLSANTIFLAFDHPAEINKGFVVDPNQSFSMSVCDTSYADVNAIASGADSLISFQEFSCRSL